MKLDFLKIEDFGSKKKSMGRRKKIEDAHLADLAATGVLEQGGSKEVGRLDSQRFRPCRIDPNFHEGLTIEVIERGSAVHCVSAYEGDVVIMGSDPSFALARCQLLKF